jgi:hypothetical protein
VGIESCLLALLRAGHVRPLRCSQLTMSTCLCVRLHGCVAEALTYGAQLQAAMGCNQTAFKARGFKTVGACMRAAPADDIYKVRGSGELQLMRAFATLAPYAPSCYSCPHCTFQSPATACQATCWRTTVQ